MKRLIVFALMIAAVFSLTACSKQAEQTGTPPSAPASEAVTAWKENTDASSDRMEEFCFSLEWGCNGDSTYDSQTGKLIKQKVATDVDAYTTTLLLSDEQKAEIFRLVSDMKPETYPDEYNPITGMSSPSRTIVLSVTYGGETKTITCEDVSLQNTPDGSKGKRFMAVHDKIVEIITASAEWQALPDYEFYYD